MVPTPLFPPATHCGQRRGRSRAHGNPCSQAGWGRHSGRRGIMLVVREMRLQGPQEARPASGYLQNATLEESQHHCHLCGEMGLHCMLSSPPASDPARIGCGPSPRGPAWPGLTPTWGSCRSCLCRTQHHGADAAPTQGTICGTDLHGSPAALEDVLKLLFLGLSSQSQAAAPLLPRKGESSHSS